MMLYAVKQIAWTKKATFWAFSLSLGILIFTGVLARITLEITGSVVNNPDLAVVVLMKEVDDVQYSTLLRESEFDRDYLVETHTAKWLVKLHKSSVTDEWSIKSKQNLRE